MALSKSKSHDYPNVISADDGGGAGKNDYAMLAPTRKKEASAVIEPQTFSSKKGSFEIKKDFASVKEIVEKITDLPPSPDSSSADFTVAESEDVSFAEKRKLEKNNKKESRDKILLKKDNWLSRNGHIITYAGLYLFSAFVFFRPYELPQLAFLQSGAFFLALATILVYLPTQFAVEGSPTIFTTEVKAILFLTGLALLTMPIAKDPALAWETFNSIFIKAVAMFVVMVNVLRTRRRLLGIMWISFGISIVLCFTALGMFMRGELRTEGYRVSVDFGGMLGNPNDLALHLVTMTPLVICLGIAAKNNLRRVVYFATAILFVAGISVTYSRGGFLGLIVAGTILLWKIGRKRRITTIAVAAVIGILFILLAPGHYGMRLLSIFMPSLDAVGSSDQRKESLIISIIVTLRNPQGIGIGCFPIVGLFNLQTHNAYTQVSAELGWLGIGAYLTFIVSALRKLMAVERTVFATGKTGWHYYLAIGLQASIAGFMVSSFFSAVAYNWFVYYLIAYAVAFRRIYQIEKGEVLK